MALNLLNLLGQFAGSQIEPEFAEDGSTDITVRGNSPLRYDPRQDPERATINDPSPRPAIDPRYVLNDDRMQPSKEDLKGLDLGFRGPFGSKGTLRDVLGTLGDAFLIQGGAKPMYAPKKQMEEEAEALFGFTQNPQQAMERLARRNPEAAQKLYTDYNDLLMKQATLQSQEAARQNLMQDRNFGNREVGLNRLSRWAASGMPYDLLVKGAAQYGITPEELAAVGVTPDMTDEQRAAFVGGDMTVNQIRNLPLSEQRVAIAQQNANSAERNSRRGFAPKSTTNVQTWTGDDGYEYTQRSDGTVVKSTTKVKPPGRGNGRRSIGADPERTKGWSVQR